MIVETLLLSYIQKNSDIVYQKTLEKNCILKTQELYVFVDMNMFKSNFNSELALYGENKNFQIIEVNAYKSLRLDMKNFQIIKVQLSTSFEKTLRSQLTNLNPEH